MPRGKFDAKKLKPGGEYKMDSATSAKVEEMISEVDQHHSEMRVNFRWGREQLDLVKKVASLMGVPYQTYIKQVVFRQCLEDLQLCTEARKKNP